MKLVDILSRPQVGLLALIDVLPSLNNFIGEFVLRDEIIEAAEISIKYSGYIERERMLADKLSRLENLVIAKNSRICLLKLVKNCQRFNLEQ